MATRYGKTFTTRRGRRGRYKYVNGRRVGFVTSHKSRRSHRGKRRTSRRYTSYHRRY